MNEETLFSESGIHFGHYIGGCKLDIISHYHATRVSTVLSHAIQLKQWSWGLSVMLEKTLGVTLVMKLRTILLMEAYSNATNKIIYGNQMLYNVREYNLMPKEVFSEKIAWPTTVLYARHYSMTSFCRQEFLLLLHPLTHQTALNCTCNGISGISSVWSIFFGCGGNAWNH